MRTPQTPIGSGYSAFTTAREIVWGLDLWGKVAIVTGGYAGIGLEVTQALTSAGASVVAPARDREKAARSIGTMPRVEIESIDLMDPTSIDAFAQRFVASRRPLHFLINNAGIMAPPLVRDARGFESQLSTNHLGHFQLTLQLWPVVRRTRGGRVVSVSSRGHARAAVDFDDPNFDRRRYDPWLAYGQSRMPCSPWPSTASVRTRACVPSRSIRAAL